MKKYLLIGLLAISGSTFAQSTKIVAHRGAWKNTKVPQNSIAALQEAIKLKVWGSEFDVSMTKDSVLVVNHDNDYKGIDIATNTYATLLQKPLDNGEKIPTAEEYLKVGLKQKKTRMVFEIKPNKLGAEQSKLSARLAYDLVKRYKGLKRTVFISFSYDVCQQLVALDKKVKVQYLGGNKTPAQLKQDGISGLDYHYSVYNNNPTYIEDAKKLKLETNVWTVNSESDMVNFIQKKINYITTDQPELLKKLIK